MWCCGKVDVIAPSVVPTVPTVPTVDPAEVKATHDLIDEIVVNEIQEESLTKEEQLTQDAAIGILGIAFLFTMAYLMLNSKVDEPFRIDRHPDL
jgi:hypothetical protein